MDYLKSVFTKKQILWLIISGSVLLLFLIIMGIGIKMSETQSAQMGAKRWSKDNDYAQVSAFFSEMAHASEDTVKELNFKIDQKLDEDSLVAPNKNARRRVSGYSALGEVSVTSEKNTQEVKAIGIGGDFFLFHPLKMISGSYFDGEDVMQDHVILDHETAWQLFGSTDVVGQQVLIGGEVHIISGVYEKDRGRLNRLSGNDEPTVFVSYESLENYGYVICFNSFEVIMPNPVTGYALKILTDAMPIDKARCQIVENSGRFNFVKLLPHVASFGSRSMNEKSVLYPYWENMARGMEDLITPLCVIDLLLFLFVVTNLVVLIVRMWTKRTIHFKDVKNFFERRVEIYREKKKENKKLDGGEYL